MTTSHVLSLGGLFVGLAIVTWHLTRWWIKGGGGSGKAKKSSGAPAPTGGSRNPKDLIPFGSSMAFGLLAGSCTGGLLGTITGWIAGASNSAGNRAMGGMTGSATPTVTRGHLAALNPGGALITMLAVVVIAALWKKIGKHLRAKIGSGFWAGSLLSMAAGIAGYASMTLIPVVNTVGGVLYQQVAS